MNPCSNCPSILCESHVAIYFGSVHYTMAASTVEASDVGVVMVGAPVSVVRFTWAGVKTCHLMRRMS